MDNLKLAQWPRPNAADLKLLRDLGGRVQPTPAGIAYVQAFGFSDVPTDVIARRMRADVIGTLP